MKVAGFNGTHEQDDIGEWMPAITLLNKSRTLAERCNGLWFAEYEMRSDRTCIYSDDTYGSSEWRAKRRTREERSAEILADRQSGKTLREIGIAFKINKERVRQIVSVEEMRRRCWRRYYLSPNPRMKITTRIIIATARNQTK